MIVICFRIFLLLLPIRIIQYGNILIALGKSKILMKRSVIELILNLIISVILFKFIGYLGVAIGSVVSIIFWTVPFNLKIIANGFGMSFSSIIPLKKLFIILICSTISLLCVVVSNYFLEVSSNNLIVFFLISSIIYGIAYLLFLFVFKLVAFDPKSKLKFKLY
jgi:O-antigen/teichoic acid export membrane protein